MALNDANCLMLRLLLLMLTNVLTTFWCRSVVKIYFCSYLSTRFGQDFEADVWSVFCCWCLVEVMKLILSRDSEAEVLWRCWCLVDILCWCLFEILRMNFDQDLCENSWYERNPGVRCAFGNISFHSSWLEMTWRYLFFLNKQIAEHLGQISNERDLWSTSINFINSVFWSLLKTSLRTTPPCTSRCLVMKIRSSKDEWSTKSNNHLWSTDLFRS